MSASFPDLDIHQLDPAQKLDLIGLLWDSLPETMESAPLPDWHRDELERRVASADASPAEAIPWEQVRDRLRQKP
jgi:putative addiction module component (TIGR02574 family)